jgi:hypothetical protein
VQSIGDVVQAQLTMSHELKWKGPRNFQILERDRIPGSTRCQSILDLQENELIDQLEETGLLRIRHNKLASCWRHRCLHTQWQRSLTTVRQRPLVMAVHADEA